MDCNTFDQDLQDQHSFNHVQLYLVMDWLFFIGIGGFGIIFFVGILTCLCNSSSVENDRVAVNVNNRCEA